MKRINIRSKLSASDLHHNTSLFPLFEHFNNLNLTAHLSLKINLFSAFSAKFKKPIMIFNPVGFLKFIEVSNMLKLCCKQ